jgi:hypothetical protein
VPYDEVNRADWSQIRDERMGRGGSVPSGLLQFCPHESTLTTFGLGSEAIDTICLNAGKKKVVRAEHSDEQYEGCPFEHLALNESTPDYNCVSTIYGIKMDVVMSFKSASSKCTQSSSSS